jgi:hypothetical protein
MTSGDLPVDPGPSGSAPRGGRRRAPAVLITAAVCCLAVVVAASLVAVRTATRKPTAAQLASAAAKAVAQRWRSWPAGRIFPEELAYSTDLLTTETAGRVAISPQDQCALAVEPAVAALATHDHCLAGLRASYVGQLGGIVYTVGVLAFPSARLADSFASRLAATSAPAMPLRSLAVAGTATALFSPAARQSAIARHAGPFVVLTVAGYADGEPKGAGQQARPSVFAPATQLAAEILRPLIRPQEVNCASEEFSC